MIYSERRTESKSVSAASAAGRVLAIRATVVISAQASQKDIASWGDTPTSRLASNLLNSKAAPAPSMPPKTILLAGRRNQDAQINSSDHLDHLHETKDLAAKMLKWNGSIEHVRY
jgi:hypothetical protein